MLTASSLFSWYDQLPSLRGIKWQGIFLGLLTLGQAEATVKSDMADWTIMDELMLGNAMTLTDPNAINDIIAPLYAKKPEKISPEIVDILARRSLEYLFTDIDAGTAIAHMQSHRKLSKQVTKYLNVAMPEAFISQMAFLSKSLHYYEVNQLNDIRTLQKRHDKVSMNIDQPIAEMVLDSWVLMEEYERALWGYKQYHAQSKEDVSLSLSPSGDIVGFEQTIKHLEKCRANQVSQVNINDVVYNIREHASYPLIYGHYNEAILAYIRENTVVSILEVLAHKNKHYEAEIKEYLNRRHQGQQDPAWLKKVIDLFSTIRVKHFEERLLTADIFEQAAQHFLLVKDYKQAFYNLLMAYKLGAYDLPSQRMNFIRRLGQMDIANEVERASIKTVVESELTLLSEEEIETLLPDLIDLYFESTLLSLIMSGQFQLSLAVIVGLTLLYKISPNFTSNPKQAELEIKDKKRKAKTKQRKPRVVAKMSDIGPAPIIKAHIPNLAAMRQAFLTDLSLEPECVLNPYETDRMRRQCRTSKQSFSKLETCSKSILNTIQSISDLNSKELACLFELKREIQEEASLEALEKIAAELADIRKEFKKVREALLKLDQKHNNLVNKHRLFQPETIVPAVVQAPVVVPAPRQAKKAAPVPAPVARRRIQANHNEVFQTDELYHQVGEELVQHPYFQCMLNAITIMQDAFEQKEKITEFLAQLCDESDFKAALLDSGLNRDQNPEALAQAFLIDGLIDCHLRFFNSLDELNKQNRYFPRLFTEQFARQVRHNFAHRSYLALTDQALFMQESLAIAEHCLPRMQAYDNQDFHDRTPYQMDERHFFLENMAETALADEHGTEAFHLEKVIALCQQLKLNILVTRFLIEKYGFTYQEDNSVFHSASRAVLCQIHEHLKVLPKSDYHLPHRDKFKAYRNQQAHAVQPIEHDEMVLFVQYADDILNVLGVNNYEPPSFAM